MKILIIAYPSLLKDPRPYRQISLLHKDNYIHTIGGAPSGLENNFTVLKKHKFILELLRLIALKFKFYSFYNLDIYKRQVIKKMTDESFDLVIVHEVRLLPMALLIAKGTPVILDAHEYSPKNFDDNIFWRFFIKKYYIFLCEKFIPKTDKILTVSDGIVRAYKEKFNKETYLLTNAASYERDIFPNTIAKDKIRLIHHGIASSSRKLELLIEMMKFLDNNKYELTFMLTSSTLSKFYLNRLKKMSKDLNILFVPPVEREDLIRFSSKYDIGVHFVPPTNFNLKYGLGNKFFEFIQSRLVIAIGPDIEMSKYVKKYKLGIIANTWEPRSLADAISNVSNKKLMFFKNQAHKYAEKLSSKENDKLFCEIIKSYNI